MISIRTSDERTAFYPSEAFRGTVQWSCRDALSRLELRLFWRTSGKGTVDTKVVDSLRWEGLKNEGERSFSFKIPGEPYSFSGRLISLLWAAEAVAEGEEFRETALYDLAVSPHGTEVMLYETMKSEEE